MPDLRRDYVEPLWKPNPTPRRRDKHPGQNVPADPIPDEVKRYVWERDAGRCQMPGHRHEGTDPHHIKSKGMGGTKLPGHNDPDKLVLLNHKCHMAVQESMFWKRFWRYCAQQGMLGEANRKERDAVYREWTKHEPPADGVT